MTLDAITTLDNLEPGSFIILSGENIAEIINKNEDCFEIKDIHGKYWRLHREKLENANYSQFLQELALIIDQNWYERVNQHLAQEVLSKMPVNTHIYHGHEWIASLIDVNGGEKKGQILTFEDKHGNELTIDLEKLSEDFTYDDFLSFLLSEIEHRSKPECHTILMDFFNEEFIPMMLEQMKYDHYRLGDSWLMKPTEGYEKQIQRRYAEYFEMFEKDGKEVPWLKIAGYAIIAQARHDHPEWLF